MSDKTAGCADYTRAADFFTATIYPQLLQVFGGFINNLFISYPQEVLVCDRGNILLSAP